MLANTLSRPLSSQRATGAGEKHNIAYGIISGNDGGCEGFYQGVNSAQRILRVHITGLG